MVLYLILFAAGALSAPLVSVAFIFIGLAVCTLLLFASKWLYGRQWRLSLVPCVVLILGFGLGRTQVWWQTQQQLPNELERADAQLLFTIASPVTRHNERATFIAQVQQAECLAQDCSLLAKQKLRVQWYYPPAQLQPGQIYSALLRLKRPRGLANPVGFDYQAWLLSQGIYASAYVRGEAQLIGHCHNLATARHALAAHLFRDSEPRFARFFNALVFGDKSALQVSDWQVLQATGTVHLMAISGLHIGLVASLAFALGVLVARLCSLLSPGSNVWLLTRLPALLGLTAATGYATLAGFSVPTVRALIACGAVSCLALTARRVQASTVLAGCVALVAVIEPFAALMPGFWLSFGAVFILFWSFSGRRTKALAGLLKVQWALFVGLLLPLLLFGQGLSLSAPIANLIAVPLVSFIVVPGLFLALICSFWPGLSCLLLWLVDAAFTGLWWVLTALADTVPLWRPAVMQNPWLLALAGCACLMLLAPKGLGLRLLGGLLLGSVWVLPVTRDYSLKLTVLDAGQGLAAVIQLPMVEPWVYDTGAQFSDQFDIGSGVVAPFLLSEGYSRARLMVSHNDADHAGGVAGLSQRVTITQLLTGESTALPGVVRKPCAAGSHWREADVLFAVLWPQEADQNEGNDASCVLLLQFEHAGARVRILFTGDISATVERQLLAVLPKDIDLLIAPHHGSKTSSHGAFVHKLNPRYVVFSAGFNNRYRHPNAQVVARYKRAGATVLNTAEDGAITFVWPNDGGMKLDRLRKSTAKPWY